MGLRGTVFVGLFLLISLVGAEHFEGNSNSIDQDIAPSSPIKLDPHLIDDLLSSDYFEDDKESAEGVAPASLPVEPSVVEEQEQVSTKAPCTGCPREVDIEDPKIKEMAVFAFNTHFSEFDPADQGQKMVRVVNAMTQVVAGQKYILDLEVGVTNCTKGQHDNEEKCELDPSVGTFVCNFEVVEQVWMNNKEVVRSNCRRERIFQDEQDEQDRDGGDFDSDEVEEATIVQRKKREDAPPVKHVLGGSRDAEDSKDKLMDLATFAVQQLDKIDADDDARLVIEVLDSKKQTVSGWLYDLKIRVAHTTCKEDEPISLEKCKDKIVLPYRVCSIKILFQPWQEVQRKVTESQCYPEKVYYKKGKKLGKKLKLEEYNAKNEVHPKRKKLGGFQDIDLKNEGLTELVNFIVDSIDQQSNALHAQKLVKIVEAQRQVVAGLKTKLVVELGYTSCRKHPSLDKSQCEIDDQREHQFCNVTVWEQPWLKSKQITHSKCGPHESMFSYRNKRSVGFFHAELDDFIEKTHSEKDHKEFRSFMGRFDKNYDSQEEYKYRLGVFKENMKKVTLLENSEQGTAKYGPTIFADLTEEEFSKHHLGLRPDLKQGFKKVKKAKVPFLTSIPDEFDWRNYNAVTPVKNQGMCGSCWAFSVTGNIEGLYAKKHNKLMSFSEQELVDCDTLDSGCEGGLPENAYKALEKIGGLETESAYPYDGHNDKCSFNFSKAAARVTGFVELPKNETEMAMWLLKNGPISIGINANAMQFYMGGVSHPWKFLCSKKSLDHGVLLVGFGVHTTSIRHKTMPYWIVKNSWGTSWGEKGYYRIYRGENTCGLAEMATSAVVE